MSKKPVPPLPTEANVVMDDTFTDPDLGYDDRSNLPLTSTNSVWFTGASPQSLVAYQQNGNLVGTTVAGVSSLWLGYFVETNQPPVHLAVGRTLLVRLPFIANSYSLHTNNSGLRLGLFDYADGGTRVTAVALTLWIKSVEILLFRSTWLCFATTILKSPPNSRVTDLNTSLGNSSPAPATGSMSRTCG